jgi:tetratricopeptide (TPR) repeat protein
VHLNRSLCRILVVLAILVAAVPFSSHAVQEAGVTKAARDAGPAYMRALESAAAAYAQRAFPQALEKLDQADQIAPNIPDTWYMRGAIYAEEHAFEEAEDAFEKAEKLNPGDFWPKYNLAELLLMQKKYGPAAEAFQKLEIYAGTEELVQFKIVFADLMQGKPDAAKPVLDGMKFPCDTPAYYFAHAAWGFAHKDQKEGNYWTRAGLKVFGEQKCIPFYDSMVGVEWLPMRNVDGSVPVPAELSTLPAATPGALDIFPHAAATP